MRRTSDRSWTPRLLAAVLVLVALVVPSSVSAADETVVVPDADWSVSLVHLGGVSGRWEHPSVSFDEGTGSLTLTEERDGGLRVDATRPGESGEPGQGVDLRFRPPPGEPLRVGTYVRARTSTPFLQRAGLDLSQNLLGCSTGGGTFTVHRLEPDLGAVHISWHTSCGRGGSFGELRVGASEIPADGDPGDRLVAAPYAVDWPKRLPGETAEAAPVRIANDSAVPATVLDVSVRGEDAEDVDLTHDCGVLAAGAACTASVEMTPGAVGPRRAEVVVTHNRGQLVVPVSVVGATWTASLRVATDEGTWEVLDGEAWGYGDEHSLDLSARSDDLDLSVRMQAPTGEALVPGTYSVGTGPGSGARRGLLSTGFPDYCTASGGAFTIHRAGYDEVTGELTSLVASWHHRCGTSGDRAAQGSIVWQADADLPALGELTPWRSESVGDVTVMASTGEAVVAYTSPRTYGGGGRDRDAVIVRVREGDEPMTDPDEGEPAVRASTAGGREAAYVPGLPTGRDHTIAFFVDPQRGEDPPPQNVLLRGTALDVSSRVEGARRTIRARLVDVDGRGLARRRVTAEVWPPGGAVSTRRLRTGTAGRLSLTVPRNALTQLAFGGSGAALGSVTSVGTRR